MQQRQQQTGGDDVVVRERDRDMVARRRRIAACLWSGGLALAAIVVTARLSGAIADQLHPLFAVFGSLLSWSMVVTAWWLQWDRSTQRPFSSMLLSGVGSTVLPLLTGGGLLAAGNAIGFLTMLFGSLLAGIGCAVWSGLTASSEQPQANEQQQQDRGTCQQEGYFDHVPMETQRETVAAGNVEPSTVKLARNDLAAADQVDVAIGELNPAGEIEAGFFEDSSIEQQWTRRSTRDGVEVEVLSRVRFAEGQRQQTVHLPLTPAFARPPEVEVESLGEVEVELTVPTVYAYGVRVDVRRASAIDAADAVIGITLKGSVPMEKAA